MCSKHVEAWNKLIIKFSASSCLILRQKYFENRSRKLKFHYNRTRMTSRVISGKMPHFLQPFAVSPNENGQNSRKFGNGICLVSIFLSSMQNNCKNEKLWDTRRRKKRSLRGVSPAHAGIDVTFRQERCRAMKISCEFKTQANWIRTVELYWV